MKEGLKRKMEEQKKILKGLIDSEVERLIVRSCDLCHVTSCCEQQCG